MIEERAWYARPKSEVLQLLQTDPLKGLSPEEAAKRLAQYGPNELAAEKKTSPWKMLLEQFTSILIVILLAATVVSAVLGETLDALVIFIIVIACAVLGFVQEYRASKAMEALKKMAALTAPVVRGGEECQVPAAEVVPGDIVILNTGEKVPADCLLLEAVNLKAEEAALTGESMPVSKEAGIVLAPETALGDRRNMVFAATVINYGRGRGVVVATGMQTEFGRIAGLMQEVEAPPTPLEQRLDVVGKWLGILCLAVVGLVTGVEVLLRGEPLLAMFIWGVSLAVAAVPE
ncbi:MAG: HAD-IC family P-type ATPase, partial [Clostridia bacterium]|nr:HAD-IC family P-type ATPase [Clostridia bacterium]